MTTNMLTSNQATATDTLQTTTGFYFSVCTGASTTAQYVQGSRSLELTSTGTGNVYAYAGLGGTSGVPISGSTQYTGYAQVRKHASATGLYGVALIWWFDAAGAQCSPTYVSEVNSVALSSSAWTEVTGSVTSPADAAYARFAVSYQTSNTAGSIYYADQLGMWLGAGGSWEDPANPPVNNVTYGRFISIGG